VATVARPAGQGSYRFTVENDTVTAVIVGETWWSWSPSREVTTNQGDPHHSHGRGPGVGLIDPSSILPAVELVLAGRATFIGRSVLEVLATPSPVDENDEESWDWRNATHDLGGGADDYSLVVDAERGILLRSEARIEGQPFRIIEMETVAFDEELGEKVFAPPTDRDIEPARVPRAVSLSELPDAVSFAVLVPEHPPFGVDDVDVLPPDRRRGIPEQVHIAFASNFFGEEDRCFWLRVGRAASGEAGGGMARGGRHALRRGPRSRSSPPGRPARASGHAPRGAELLPRDRRTARARALTRATSWGPSAPARFIPITAILNMLMADSARRVEPHLGAPRRAPTRRERGPDSIRTKGAYSWPKRHGGRLESARRDQPDHR
jgi:hypothetical protein